MRCRVVAIGAGVGLAVSGNGASDAAATVTTATATADSTNAQALNAPQEVTLSVIADEGYKRVFESSHLKDDGYHYFRCTSCGKEDIHANDMKRWYADFRVVKDPGYWPHGRI